MEWSSTNDESRLRDILEHGRIAVGLARHFPGTGAKATTHRLALERALFIVGEAARTLCAPTRRAIRQPWSDIIALRNVLAHHYEALRVDRLVEIALKDLPPLLAAVEEFLGERGRRV